MIVGQHWGGDSYPSGHATDTVGFSTPERAESLRDPACTDLKRVYINLDSPQSMVEAHKKNESESESEQNEAKWHIEGDQICKRKYAEALFSVLEKRIKALEEHLMSLDHGNEHGNDPRDGGWFD